MEEKKDDYSNIPYFGTSICRDERVVERDGELYKDTNMWNSPRTRIDVYETLCPQQMLVHKGGKIKNWGGECRDVTPTKSLSQNIRVDVNREAKFCENSKKIFFLGGEGGGGGQVRGREGDDRGGGGGHKVNVNKELKFLLIQKKNWGGRGGGGYGRKDWVGLGGGQVGCERRIEVFVKIKKNWVGGRVGGVRLDVN